MKNRLAKIDAKIWIEYANTPALQREEDQSIMEAFIRRKIKPTILRLRKLNAVRIYLRVIILADIGVENGEYIGHTTLGGNFIAGTDCLHGTAMKPTKTGSDGSVHREHNVAAVAWIIPTNENEYLKAFFLMTYISSVNSYRVELEGIEHFVTYIQYLDRTIWGYNSMV